MTRQHHRDHGSVSVEFAIAAPVVLLLVAAMIAAGRIVLAHGTVTDVAAAAARSASIARTAAQAQRDATDTARRILAEQRLHCKHTEIAVDTSGFTVPLGQAAVVRVDVTCVVPLSDLALPGGPRRPNAPGHSHQPARPVPRQDLMLSRVHIRRSKRRWGSGDEGSISVMTAVLTAALLLVFALLVDASGKMRAIARADTVAAEAARAALSAVDTRSTTVSVDLSTAVNAAQSYLAQTGYAGTVEITGPRTITVTIAFTQQAAIGLLGSSYYITASATAELGVGTRDTSLGTRP
jgi:Flp pilus assembly protein TadG